MIFQELEVINSRPQPFEFYTASDLRDEMDQEIRLGGVTPFRQALCLLPLG
jgi:hypothetical protein